jgi:predicted Zn-dependent protease with MMP-like domain
MTPPAKRHGVLYRRPLLDYWAAVRRRSATSSPMFVHEIGHHFGLSDADMERIDASVSD